MSARRDALRLQAAQALCLPGESGSLWAALLERKRAPGRTQLADNEDGLDGVSTRPR
jgi:hypothetical protein